MDCADTRVDANDVMFEYGVDLVAFDTIRDADCLVFAVAHDEFKKMKLEQINELFGEGFNEEKVIIDVKSILDKKEIEKLGYSYWRL